VSNAAAATIEPSGTTTNGGSRAWGSNDSIVLFAITAIAAFSRVFRLSSPDRLVFDETYYAKESCFYLEASKQLCEWPKSPPAEVHPPLAKWLMGVGIKIFGFEAFGWRIVSVLAGVISVVLLYLLARKLLGSTLAAGTAAGILALDPLHFVHSRTALLDIYPMLFGVAAFLFLAYDRDRMMRASAGERGVWARPWRLAAGLAGGAATASKWSGGLVLAGVIVITLVWEVGRRREQGWGRAFLETLRREGPSMVVYLGLAPFAFYVATYIGRLEGPVLDPMAQGSWAREWLRYQTNAFTFHRNLQAHHGYESPPALWILMKRPLLYWSEQSGENKSSI
jgi:4-amino-4-deoxy-L-arabinose transferase-like glycosyltransferase